MKKIKKLVEVEVDVLEYTDIAAKMVSMVPGDSVVFNKKDFENGELSQEGLRAFQSLGIEYVDDLSPKVRLYKHPRHKSLTYTTQWNDDQTECIITRVHMD